MFQRIIEVTKIKGNKINITVSTDVLNHFYGLDLCAKVASDTNDEINQHHLSTSSVPLGKIIFSDRKITFIEINVIQYHSLLRGGHYEW